MAMLLRRLDGVVKLQDSKLLMFRAELDRVSELTRLLPDADPLVQLPDDGGSLRLQTMCHGALTAAVGRAGARRRPWVDGVERGAVAGMNRLQWSQLSDAEQAQALQRPVQAVAARTRESVAALIAAVRDDGDAALREISLRFDGVAPASFEVNDEEFAAAERTVPGELRRAMTEAADRIRLFHKAGMSGAMRWTPRPACAANAWCGRLAGWACTCRRGARHCRPPH